MPNNKETQLQWYKNAVFYAVIVEVFKDGNADGIGDFVGLTLKLDYIKELGVDCIWLLPFYPSGGRDNGYDVTDYYNVDSRIGTLGEFKTFVKEAAKRDIKVIIDLVVHHTSDKHPWFIEASQDEDSKYHDYYVWTREIPKYEQPKSAFPGIEAGVWRYSGEAQQFFYHSFYDFMPDLNIVNPDVQLEIQKIMDFWMDLGIAGFRIDAATLMFARKGLIGTDVPEPGPIMEGWNKHIKDRNPEAIILGEADVTVEEIPTFFGEGGRMDLLYNFLLNRYLFLSLAEKDASAIYKFMDKLPKPPEKAQWVDFLRNHDELNIEQLEEKEKETVFKTFAPHESMVVYDRGIRRRLAPMFEGDIKRLKMAYTLLFSLPGAQMILYGDEIGMGENLKLSERTSVRIPMQWANMQNADFSDSHPSTMVRGINSEGQFGFEKVNVADQLKDKKSLYYHIKKLISLIKENKHIGHGKYNLVDVYDKHIFALKYDWENETLIILVNLADKPSTAHLGKAGFAIEKEIYNDGDNKKPDKDGVSLNPYGYRWFFVKKQ